MPVTFFRDKELIKNYASKRLMYQELSGVSCHYFDVTKKMKFSDLGIDRTIARPANDDCSLVGIYRSHYHLRDSLEASPVGFFDVNDC